MNRFFPLSSRSFPQAGKEYVFCFLVTSPIIPVIPVLKTIPLAIAFSSGSQIMQVEGGDVRRMSAMPRQDGNNGNNASKSSYSKHLRLPNRGKLLGTESECEHAPL